MRKMTMNVQRACYSTGMVRDKFSLLRSLLFIPGNSHKMLNKMITLPARPDAFVPDLEDSVPIDSKEEARKLVSDFIDKQWAPVSRDMPLLIPRVNATLGDDVLFSDIKSMCTPFTAALTFGKAESEKDVDRVVQFVRQVESENNLAPNSIKLIPWIETALGIVNAYQIASCASDRVIAVAFGADDYAFSLGVTRNTKQNVERELEYPRSAIAVAAIAAKIVSLDTPNVNFKDPQSIVEESNAVKQIGFKGKFAIHPSQVDPINEIFGISDEEWSYAKRVVEAYNNAASGDQKRGSTQVDGRMIDMPVYRRYEAVYLKGLAQRQK